MFDEKILFSCFWNAEMCMYLTIIEVLLKSFDAQSPPGTSYFSFKVQKCPIFKVLNLKKKDFNGSELRHFSCTIHIPKFENE